MIIKKYSDGFTLIELLLYVGLAGAVLLGVSIFLSVILSSQVKNRAISEVEQQGRQIVFLIQSAVEGGAIVNIPAIGASSSSLSIGRDESMINPIIFDLSGGKIRITEGSGLPVELNSDWTTAANLLFENTATSGTPDLIRFSFDLSYINDNSRQEFNYSKTFYGSVGIKK
jgi:type II secretory pathway pseudopilin PulG